MSTLVFDGFSHTLTLYDKHHKEVGQWHANNIVDHRATLKFVPNRIYPIIDRLHPHRHGGSDDTLNGPFGRFGIIRLHPFTAEGHLHEGVGIHSGRADKHGADHPTMGCIRTTDKAMAAIVCQIQKDPLHSITVRHNHDQHNKHHGHQGDHHHPGHTIQPAHQSGPGSIPMI